MGLSGPLAETTRSRRSSHFGGGAHRFGRPLWDMLPADAVSYFGPVRGRLVGQHDSLGCQPLGAGSSTCVRETVMGHASRGSRSSYFGTVLRAVPLEALRVDRQLDEALTHGPDPLHLAVVFGLDETTAIRYCAAARQILQTPAEEHDPPG